MPNIEKQERLDYKKFDNMNTDILKAILQADYDAPEAEQLDTDTLMYIGGLLAERKKTSSTPPIKDVASAKAEFYRDYYPYKDNTDLLQEFAGEFPTTETPNTKVISRRSGLFKQISAIAAAFVIMLFLGSITAYALGYNLFSIRAVWDNEHFWFEKDYPTFELMQAITKYDNIDNLIPKWLPDNYEFENISIIEDSFTIEISSDYVRESASGTDMLHIGCVYMNNRQTGLYEKDSMDVDIYNSHNKEYYIMPNIERMSVVWVSGNTEYYISGNLSSEEIKKMIDSIYEE